MRGSRKYHTGHICGSLGKEGNTRYPKFCCRLPDCGCQIPDFKPACKAGKSKENRAKHKAKYPCRRYGDFGTAKVRGVERLAGNLGQYPACKMPDGLPVKGTRYEPAGDR